MSDEAWQAKQWEDDEAFHKWQGQQWKGNDEAFHESQAKQLDEKCEQATIEVIEVAKTFRPSFSVSEAKRKVITETIDEAHRIDDPEWSFDVTALIGKLSCLLDLDAAPAEEQLEGMFPL